eukprot:TRINITY_DN17977_c0_g1_i1.p1 TRINITY_DN17977_c0_g1~~TRINITY_DN17977_c0_g1_i1.p1  ORF type:complete len:233 (+),score=20.09 TRINITY_DN17977_c0_g1_i1:42-701(+)
MVPIAGEMDRRRFSGFRRRRPLLSAVVVVAFACALLSRLPALLRPAFSGGRWSAVAEALPRRPGRLFAPTSRARGGAVTRAALMRVVNPPKPGDREIVDGPDGPIIVANVEGEYYAVSATCPHLNLPMKRAAISQGSDGPEITCNFHNSCWKMRSGECTKWVTGALGFQNGLVAGVMNGLGGAKSDLPTYRVVDVGDGYLWVETDASPPAAAASDAPSA